MAYRPRKRVAPSPPDGRGGRSVSRRKIAGGVALGLLLLLGLAVRYVAGVGADDWEPLWALAYAIALCAAMAAAFYDRRNLPAKTWDFNPKRGAFYFLLGWIIFPLMMIVDAAFGAGFPLDRMIAGTLIMSVLIGVAGTFTENVGV